MQTWITSFSISECLICIAAHISCSFICSFIISLFNMPAAKSQWLFKLENRSYSSHSLSRFFTFFSFSVFLLRFQSASNQTENIQLYSKCHWQWCFITMACWIKCLAAHTHTHTFRIRISPLLLLHEWMKKEEEIRTQGDKCELSRARAFVCMYVYVCLRVHCTSYIYM